MIIKLTTRINTKIRPQGHESIKYSDVAINELLLNDSTQTLTLLYAKYITKHPQMILAPKVMKLTLK
jgi:hypothetical protein